MGIGERYDGFLVDLDGTVWVGSEVVAGAAEAVRRLQEAGRAIVFITNDSRAASKELAERLRASGIEATAEDVLTAGTVTAQLAAESAPPGATAFVIGAPALCSEAAAAGLRVLDGEAGREAAVVLVALHPDFSYAELRTASAALRSGAALFATNREPGAADARRRLARNRGDPRGRRVRLRRHARRSAASRSPIYSSAGGGCSAMHGGWRWSATASPPTSPAAPQPASTRCWC